MVLAGCLLGARPDVLWTWTSGSARAVAAATSTIPIVVAPINEAIMAELVADMAHPPGNITGFTLDSREQHEKCLQLLKEVAPRTMRVGVLRNPLNPAWRYYPEVLREAARTLGVELILAEARDITELDPAFAALAAEGADALFLVNDSTFTDARPVLQHILRRASEHFLPSASPTNVFARSGGLVSLSSDATAYTRGAAVYIDRLLRGSKLSELPVVHPTSFTLAINLKTAHTLGLKVPPAILARADEVIE